MTKSLVEPALRWLERVLFALIAVMVVLVFANVVGRFLFRAAITWADEAARFLFVWLTFLGATVGLARGVHIGMDLVTQMVSAHIRRLLEIGSCLLILVFLALWGFYGLQLVGENVSYLAPATEVSMAYVYAVGPLAAFLMAVLTALRLIELVRGDAAPPHQDRT